MLIRMAAVFGLMSVSAACGGSAELGDRPDPVQQAASTSAQSTDPVTTNGPRTTTSTAAASTTSTNEPLPGTTSVSSPEVRVLETDGMRVTFVVPDDAVPTEVPPRPLQDPVILQDRWLTSCCLMVVSAQREIPRMPDKDRFATLTSNGRDWQLFEYGPLDGTKIYAFTASGDIAIGVFVSYNLDDRPAETARDLARSFVASISADFEEEMAS